MRNSTEFMKNTITEFSNFYSNDNQKVRFKIIDEIDDVKILLIEKMKFLNFEIFYEDIQNDTLLGNPKTFAHICMIIIDNAIDISNKRHIKNPWIKITTKTNKNKLMIYFEDNCQGITQKPIDTIFDLEVSSNEEKNRGIGLSIAKMLTEQKMDGEIHVKNTPDGAIFSLILPILEDATDANNL
jgi:signal transduction histidine kinase